jgi:hypothetical protein
MFRICSLFSVMFSNIQNLFSTCSECSDCSEYLAQKLICSEFLDFVVIRLHRNNLTKQEKNGDNWFLTSTVGINCCTIWSLFYYSTSKLINLLLFPSFPNSHHLRANFPNYKGPGPQIEMSRKITVSAVKLKWVKLIIKNPLSLHMFLILKKGYKQHVHLSYGHIDLWLTGAYHHFELYDQHLS